MSEPPPDRRSRTLRRAVVVALLVALLLFLLLRSCERPPGGPFDYFAAKATELGRDARRVAKFVADEVKTLPYQGNTKGALGTLWEGAGSPQEKQALANALLAHCEGGEPAAADGAAFTLRIVHRGTAETTVYDGPIGDLVGEVHSIETPAPGKTRITIRGPQGRTSDVEAGSEREELLYRVQRAGGEPLEVVRELWHRDNQIGPVAAIAGDRHDFVVLPCRVGGFVRQKEEELLAQRGRAASDDARAYLALLDYCLRSDLALADLERALHVRARFDLPRILILSRAKVPDVPDGVQAFDLRLNRVAFDGAQPSDAYLAAQVRSFVESGLEQHFLTSLTQQPCTSTYDVFRKLNDGLPNSYDRRLGLVRQAIAALGERGRATFRARQDGPSVVVSKDGERCSLTGTAIHAQLASQLAKVPGAPAIDRQDLAPDDAALGVELALLASGAAPDYVLDVVELARDTDSLVVPGAGFVFRWGEGERRTEQVIDVEECETDLTLAFRVQAGIRPARGRRTIASAALADATTHNPWYRSGDEAQDDATSFCVSRHVHRQLRDGNAVAMELLGASDPDADPDARRPVATRGPLTLVGRGTHRTRVNGRDEELPILRVRLGESEFAVLDDARFPVGMADKLVEVRTAIRMRLVDEAGLGIAGAAVEIAGKSRTTGPDGRFTLPPMTGRLRLSASREQRPFGECEVDLTAPGRSEVVVALPRPRTQLLFVTRQNRSELDRLELSVQARRHIDRHLDAGHQIVIPDHRVEVDGVDVIAYYAHDLESGDIIGVTEDGLHGSAAAYGRALASLARDLARARNKPQPFAHVHMMRGALVAWWIYGKDRIGGYEHEEAINKMLGEMDDWQKATNLLTGLQGVTGARSAMGRAMGRAGWNVEGAGAAAAFKIGYLGATAFLDKKLEGS
jgi:hypothetical protein